MSIRRVVDCISGEQTDIELDAPWWAQNAIDLVAQTLWEAEVAGHEELAKSILLDEVTDDPPEPPAGKARLYLKNVSGKRTVMVRDASGIHEVTREI